MSLLGQTSALLGKGKEILLKEMDGLIGKPSVNWKQG